MATNRFRLWIGKAYTGRTHMHTHIHRLNSWPTIENFSGWFESERENHHNFPHVGKELEREEVNYIKQKGTCLPKSVIWIKKNRIFFVLFAFGSY